MLQGTVNVTLMLCDAGIGRLDLDRVAASSLVQSNLELLRTPDAVRTTDCLAELGVHPPDQISLLTICLKGGELPDRLRNVRAHGDNPEAVAMMKCERGEAS